MRRATATTGLLGLLVGLPILVVHQVGAPAWPSLRGVPLGQNYLSTETVLRILALFVWAAWAYFVAAVVLHALALATSSSDSRHARMLRTASTTIAPASLRRLIDFVISGVILASALAPKPDAPWMAASRPVPVAAAQVSNQNPAPRTAAARTYVVRSGDSLWRIAERELGSGFRWREIFELNRGKRFGAGEVLSHARIIEPGWRLLLPGEAQRAPASRTSARVHEPGRVSSHRITPSPASSHRSVAHLPQERHGYRPVIHLPSGAELAASFAAGLLTADALGRLRRRRLARLDDELEVSEDPQLIRHLRHAGATESAIMRSALEAVVLQWRSVHAMNPKVLYAFEHRRSVSLFLSDDGSELPPRSGGTVSSLVRFRRNEACVIAEVEGPFRAGRSGSAPDRLVPVAETRDGVVHVSLQGVGAIAVTGTSASKLVRDLLLANLAEARPEDVELIVLSDGDVLSVCESLPHTTRYVRSWDAAADVLRDLQTEFLRRARLFASEGVEDIHEHDEQHSDDRLPELLLVVESPPASMTGFVEGLGRDGIRFGASLVACGWDASSAIVRLHVDEEAVSLDCALPIPTHGRPLLLDEQAAAQAVTTIREAWTDSVPMDIGPNEEVVALPAPEPVREPPLRVAIELQRIEVDPIETVIPFAVEAAPAPEDPVSAVPRALSSGDAGRPSVRCLGPFVIGRGKRVIHKGWRSKAKEMLAYLVAHPDGAPKERLIEMLWPEADLATSELEFKRTTSKIRAQVRAPDDANKYVVKVGESFRLESDAWSADLWEFLRLISDSRNEAPDEQVRLLTAAIDLYGGDFCSDCYYSWAEPVRERLRRTFLRACGRLAELMCERGQQNEALSILDRAIEIEPINEDLHRRAMTIEAGLGRHDDALARFRGLEAILANEIGVDPSPVTGELVRSIQTSRTRVAVATSGSMP